MTRTRICVLTPSRYRPTIVRMTPRIALVAVVVATAPFAGCSSEPAVSTSVAPVTDGDTGANGDADADEGAGEGVAGGSDRPDSVR